MSGGVELQRSGVEWKRRSGEGEGVRRSGGNRVACLSEGCCEYLLWVTWLVSVLHVGGSVKMTNVGVEATL